MAYAMTKQGSLDNCVTYEFICDTIADMNAIENRYRTIGSVAVVLTGESGGIEAYITGSNKQWNNLGSLGASNSGSGSSTDGLSIHICAQNEVSNGVPDISSPDENTIYLVSSGNTSGNLYEEYIYVNNAWEKFGDSSIDLSGYAQKTYVDQRGIINVADYGAVGDGTTDDSTAIQAACDAGYNIYFESNKTYYLASAVVIRHDIYLHGGLNTVIKTQSVTENSTTTLNNAFIISGTTKATTTLTGNYYANGINYDNCSNKFTLTDMSEVAVGDIMEIVATDQFYSYARRYYYLGGILKIDNIYDGHLYTDINLPFNITNTENVTVKIFDAPKVTVEDLHFVSDRAQVGFVFACNIAHCKDVIVRNCSFDNMWNSLYIFRCFNSKVEAVSMSNSKYDNSLGTDSYGICVESSTNTLIERVTALCSQGCIDVTGFMPSINTWVRNCNLQSECRSNGLGMHESAYNTIIEDCTTSGMSLYGPCVVNRCNIIHNIRSSPNSENSISIYGNHNKTFGRFIIKNCNFYGDYSGISIQSPVVQEPIQAFNNLFESIEIENCYNGTLYIRPTVSETILSNVIDNLVIKNWKNCHGIWRSSNNTIKNMLISECEFINQIFMGNAAEPTTSNFTGIEYLRVIRNNPRIDKVYIDRNKNSSNVILPAGEKINLSSSTSGAHYVVCGRNIASNNPADYSIGGISGSKGNSMSRSIRDNFNNALSVNSNGQLVFTQINGSTTADIYPKCIFHVDQNMTIQMSVKIKDTGSVPNSQFKLYICVFDDNGIVQYKNQLTESTTVSAAGVTLSASYSINAGKNFIPYIYSSSPVANAQTTFEDYMVAVYPIDVNRNHVYIPYHGTSLNGDGTLYSQQGMNWIACSTMTFNTSIKANMDNMDVNETLLIPTQPVVNGTYTLQATVSNGTITYSWIQESDINGI